ncbi:MAG: 50S ribosomal protein L11 methyltransferase, partial [Acidobacteriota bacterium]|nr:50S ribosomal protein L11 methyltransferase [Acidobacteriota bacterium]
LAIHDLEAGDGWRVFFRTPSQRDSARAALGSALGDQLLALSPTDVDDEDWARRSQAQLRAVRAGRIIVAPPWDLPAAPSRTPNLEPSDPESRVPSPGLASPEPRASSPEIVIVIEPSMGFGTGHHSTTRLCLELLQTIPLAGRRVIDVGTGSAVLAIAAAKLGASGVIAMDNDPDALQNARDNIARNGADDLIQVIECDLSSISGHEADLVLANLTGAVLQRYADALRRMFGPAGVLIVSGFSPEEKDDVAGALGMSLSESRQEGEWAAATLRST